MAKELGSSSVSDYSNNNDTNKVDQTTVLSPRWRDLFRFTKRSHAPALLGTFVTALVGALTMPAFAIVYGFIFREYSDFGAQRIDGKSLRKSVDKYCLILLGIVIANWLVNSVYFVFVTIFGELQARSARQAVYNGLTRNSITWYDTQESGIAAMLPGIQMHIRDLQLSLSAPFGEGLQNVIIAVASSVVAFYFAWDLTLVIICTLPVIYIIQAIVSKKLSARSHEQSEMLQEVLKYVANAIENIDTVKYFTGEEQELRLFTRAATAAAKLYNRVAKFRSIQIGIMQFFTLSIFFQAFWYGSHLVHSKNKDVGDIMTTIWGAIMAIQGITGFLPQLIVMQRGKIASAQLEIMLIKGSDIDEHEDTDGKVESMRCKGDVSFREVTFSYPTRKDQPALKDVSLEFPTGDTTFVVGRSGSGKSTLSQLLVRFYSPLSGRITLDGISLREISIECLRQNITIVQQHSALFNDTIARNVALGAHNTDITIEQIQEAISFAMLEETIESMPEKLGTHLGMKGNALSGGQKQRVALARAKIRDTPILVLDESTSALDYITRGAMRRAIREWRKGKTLIVITHDLSEVESGDFLYLMEEGKVVQEGYRKELEEKSGPFQEFLNMQDDEGAPDDVGIDFHFSDLESDSEDSILDRSGDMRASMPFSTIHLGTSMLDRYSYLRDSWIRPESRMRGSLRDSADLSLASPGSIPQVLLTTPDTYEMNASMSRPASRSSYRLSVQRPSSRASQHSSARNSYTSDYLAVQGKEFRSRPSSPHQEYPRPLSVLPPINHSDTASNNQKARKRITRLSLIKRKKEKRNNDVLHIKEILQSVWPVLAWQSRLLVLVASFTAILTAAATPVFAWLFAQLLATFYNPGNQTRQALIYSLSILGVAVLDGTLIYLLFYLSDVVSQSWVLALKIEAWDRVLKQPREFFDDEENSLTRIAETLDHAAEEARNLPGRFASLILVIIIMVVISVIWSLITCWKLALVALAAGPVVAGFMKGYNLISSHWEHKSNEAADRISQALQETFGNIRTVRCLQLEKHFEEKFIKETDAAFRIGIKRALYSGSLFGINFAGILFVAVLLFWYGAVLIATGEFSVTNIMETFLILILSINHVGYVAHYMTQVNMARVAASRLLRLARLPTTSHERTGTEHPQSISDITFTDTTFAYPIRPTHQVLSNVSFTIPRGSCTAIVGGSGSGKSTLAALLLKMYQATSSDSDITTSSLSIGNIDINAIHTPTLRSRIALVSQSPTLFPGTISQNIAYGLDPLSPLASPSNIAAAARAAGIDNFIDSLPQGYATLIGDGGTGLSGGQAQRLAIARALVRQPDVLVLDEATSALDVASASVVRDTVLSLVGRSSNYNNDLSPIPASPASPTSVRSAGIWDDKWSQSRFSPSRMNGIGNGKEPRRDMTVIIITHAREMMAIAEHIVMLDGGRVVEEGGYRELKRRRNGAFARLLRGEASGP